MLRPSRQYFPLPLHVPAGTAMALASPRQRVELHDSALSVLTDFHLGPSVFVHAAAPLQDALKLMQHAGVRMAFVRDQGEQIRGLITAATLLSERPMMQVRQRGTRYGDLTVADVMLPTSRWECVEHSLVENARVGDVVATLAETGLLYLVVTERIDGAEVIRGLFSATRIERALGMPVTGDPTRPRRFADMLHESDVNT